MGALMILIGAPFCRARKAVSPPTSTMSALPLSSALVAVVDPG
jgi:hypothetical protein